METYYLRKISIAIAGHLLIVAASLILALAYFPFVKFHLYSPSVHTVEASGTQQINKTYEIIIPKIGASAPIIRGVNPWDKVEYMKALEKGVAQTNTSADVGESGTTYLFAHSSLPPWEMNVVNTAFLRLGELQKGDIVEIDKGGYIYKYRVVNEKIISPTDVEYIKSSSFNGLILQTCTPVGTDLNRLLVFATLSSN